MRSFEGRGRTWFDEVMQGGREKEKKRVQKRSIQFVRAAIRGVLSDDFLGGRGGEISSRMGKKKRKEQDYSVRRSGCEKGGHHCARFGGKSNAPRERKTKGEGKIEAMLI